MTTAKRRPPVSKARKKAYNDRYRAKKAGVPVCEIGGIYESHRGDTDAVTIQKTIQQNLSNLRDNIGRLILATDKDLGDLIDKIKLIQKELEGELE